MASLSSWDEDNDDGVDQDCKAGDDEEEVGDDDMASLSFWYEDSDVEEEEEGEYKAGDDDGDECSDDVMATGQAEDFMWDISSPMFTG